MPSSLALRCWFVLAAMGLVPASHAATCDATQCAYELQFAQAGFYVAQVKLPASGQEGFWGLQVMTSSGTNTGGFNAGAVLQENGDTPGFVGFYLGEAEAVSVGAYEYTGLSQLNVMVEQEVDGNRVAVFGPKSMLAGQTETTEELQPGFYIASTYSNDGDARGRFGLALGGNHFTAGVNVGGWIDTATGGTGEGFGAFYVASAQTVKLTLFFGTSYGDTGASQPDVAIFYDDNGSRSEAWNSTEGSLLSLVDGDTANTTISNPTTTEPAGYEGTVAAHNAWRAQVGVADLTWSNTLAEYAQNWANNLKLMGCALAHNPNNEEYGENVYWSMGFTPTPQQVVDSWGSEIADYDYDANTCASGKQCGHYTQIVWRDTTEVGCGKATCDGDQTVWVCNYHPPGNIIGQKPY